MGIQIGGVEISRIEILREYIAGLFKERIRKKYLYFSVGG